MSNTNTISAANSLMVQRLAQSYLSPKLFRPVRTIEGGSISTRQISNRLNVPAAAITLSHLVEHPEQGFSFRFRAVWHEGQLLRPTATHVVMEQEWDDAQHGSPAAVSAAINDWLQAVTP
jgi:hypothetical protein